MGIELLPGGRIGLNNQNKMQKPTQALSKLKDTRQPRVSPTQALTRNKPVQSTNRSNINRPQAGPKVKGTPASNLRARTTTTTGPQRTPRINTGRAGGSTSTGPSTKPTSSTSTGSSVAQQRAALNAADKGYAQAQEAARANRPFANLRNRVGNAASAFDKRFYVSSLPGAKYVPGLVRGATAIASKAAAPLAAGEVAYETTKALGSLAGSDEAYGQLLYNLKEKVAPTPGLREVLNPVYRSTPASKAAYQARMQTRDVDQQDQLQVRGSQNVDAPIPERDYESSIGDPSLYGTTEEELYNAPVPIDETTELLGRQGRRLPPGVMRTGNSYYDQPNQALSRRLGGGEPPKTVASEVARYNRIGDIQRETALIKDAQSRGYLNPEMERLARRRNLELRQDRLIRQYEAHPTPEYLRAAQAIGAQLEALSAEAGDTGLQEAIVGAQATLQAAGVKADSAREVAEINAISDAEGYASEERIAALTSRGYQATAAIEGAWNLRRAQAEQGGLAGVKEYGDIQGNLIDIYDSFTGDQLEGEVAEDLPLVVPDANGQYVQATDEQGNELTYSPAQVAKELFVKLGTAYPTTDYASLYNMARNMASVPQIASAYRNSDPEDAEGYIEMYGEYIRTQAETPEEISFYEAFIDWLAGGENG